MRARLGVSRATLREAMRTFEVQGLIRRRQGSGTFVVGKMPVIEAGLEVLESLETMAERLGLEVTVSDLHVESLPADAEGAAGLGVALGAPVTRVRRVMREESRPVAYLVDTLRAETLKPEQLGPDFRGSVLDFLLEARRSAESIEGRHLGHRCPGAGGQGAPNPARRRAAGFDFEAVP